MKRLLLWLFCAASLVLAQTPFPSPGGPNSGSVSSGGPPAGSAVTDAQCWASSTTFGVCISQIWAASAAPSTPAAGKGTLYIDSTSKNIAVKDDAGVVKHGVQTDTGTANNYISAISDTGAITKSRPSCSTLSDAGAGCSSSGGLASGAAFTPINTASGTTADWRNYSILAKIAGASLHQYPTSWKVRVRFTAGSPVIGAMKILRTLTGSASVIDSTTVQIGASSTPTLTTPGLVDTDAISLALDSTHDYWFVIFFADNAANSSVSVVSNQSVVPAGAIVINGITTGNTAGDQSGVGTIPSIANTGSPYLVVAGILP